jgi:hypothetical protein
MQTSLSERGDMRSRMSREAHVGICESVGVRFPWASRLLTLVKIIKERSQVTPIIFEEST